jgi:hypothetical protein
MSRSGRKVRRSGEFGLRFELALCLRRGRLRVPSSACEPSTSRNGGGSRLTLLLMRAAIWSGSPGASRFLGPTIRKKLWAGI